MAKEAILRIMLLSAATYQTNVSGTLEAARLFTKIFWRGGKTRGRGSSGGRVNVSEV